MNRLSRCTLFLVGFLLFFECQLMAVVDVGMVSLYKGSSDLEVTNYGNPNNAEIKEKAQNANDQIFFGNDLADPTGVKIIKPSSTNYGYVTGDDSYKLYRVNMPNRSGWCNFNCVNLRGVKKEHLPLKLSCCNKQF